MRCWWSERGAWRRLGEDVRWSSTIRLTPAAGVWKGSEVGRAGARPGKHAMAGGKEGCTPTYGQAVLLMMESNLIGARPARARSPLSTLICERVYGASHHDPFASLCLCVLEAMPCRLASSIAMRIAQRKAGVNFGLMHTLFCNPMMLMSLRVL